MTDIQFTQITSTSCALTKEFLHDAHGSVSGSAIAHMSSGTAITAHIASLDELNACFTLLSPQQAITCGLPRGGVAELTTRAGAQFRPDALARTNATFEFPLGATLFPIDVDVDADGIFSSVDSVLDALERCSPWLAHCARVARPSASSFVGTRGLRGVHVYLAISRGADVPELAKRVQIEQWAASRGWIKISKSGALLVRQLSDNTIYQPSRLMFEAAPMLGDGVTREVPPGQGFVSRAAVSGPGAPVRYADRAGVLDVQALPPLRALDERRFDAAVKQAKNARRKEAKRIAIDYQKQNAIAAGLDAQIGERFGLLATRALGSGELPATWELAVKDVGRVKVADVLANIESALGHFCADPFDTWRPDMAPSALMKAEIVMLGDAPGVWSHKLQQFFAFTDDTAADLATPLDMAAEKLCGLVEYPEPAGKKSAPLVNILHGLSALLKEAGCEPTYDACTYTVKLDDVPRTGELLYALSRIGCAGVTKRPIEDALETIAMRKVIDPWKDAVLQLPRWDGITRLDTFFTDTFGALPADALSYTAQVFFAGICMRQLKPGSPCPIVPVLIGKPGTGKSRFIHELAGAMGFPPPAAIAFGDDIRMTMAASVSPIAELSEMSGMAKRDVEDVKLWTTECEDVYRAPYAHTAEAHPRRFVLIGTANKHELNRDPTGNRRLMPIQVTRRIDPNWVVEAKQLFAEAKERFCDKDGEYGRLLIRAADAVLDFNTAEALEGIGTAASDMDDVLPEILRILVRNHGSKLKGSQIRQALDASISGRQIKTRDYVQWLTLRGWDSRRSSCARFYVAPQHFLDDEMNKPILSVVSPFTSEKAS